MDDPSLETGLNPKAKYSQIFLSLKNLPEVPPPVYKYESQSSIDVPDGFP
jgi:hypothetical protein